MGRVCVAISAGSANDLLAKAAETARETPFIEFRLDGLDKPQLAISRLKQFLADRPLIVAIATCRRKANGGGFAGSAEEEMQHLLQAAKSGSHIVDVSLETAEELKKGALDKLREAGAAVLLSFHDFKGTPDLNAVYARMAKFAPDFYKIVPTARTLADNLKLIDLLEAKAEEASTVGVAMGECGVLSRLLGPRFGSIFTFAAPSTGEETAPGQIAARTMSELYRIETIEAATKVYGVAGSPIKNSLSPLMINSAFRRETVNSVYLALEAANVKDLLKVMERIPVRGVSITMPLKEAILPFLERTDPLSAKIGACNTVVRGEDGKLYGFNTDVGGIVGPLERRVQMRGAKVLVLGAGGAARAAVFGLKERGCDVYVLNRTPEKAQKLARQSGTKAVRRDQLAKTRFDVIVNATSYGMAGQKSEAPITPEELNCGLFFDLVYNPIETPLIRIARSKNIPVILGVEMFVQQGARQFEIWTGKPAPQDEMLRVVIHALKQQHEAAFPTPAVPPKPMTVAAPVAVKEPVTLPKTAPVKPVALPKATPVKPVAAPKAVAVKAAAPARKAPAKVVPAPAKKAAPSKKVPAKKVIAPKKVTAKAAPKKSVAKPALKKPVSKPAAKKIPAKKAGKSRR